MTKKELIEMLSPYPDDILVCVNGYEGGYNEVSNLEETKLVLNVNTAWFYGKHEELEYSSYSSETHSTSSAIILR